MWKLSELGRYLNEYVRNKKKIFVILCIVQKGSHSFFIHCLNVALLISCQEIEQRSFVGFSIYYDVYSSKRLRIEMQKKIQHPHVILHVHIYHLLASFKKHNTYFSFSKNIHICGDRNIRHT